HHGLRKLPQDRGELYEKCVEMLLKTWQEARRDEPGAPQAIHDLKLDVQTQKEYLAHLAFFVQQRTANLKDSWRRDEEEDQRGLIARDQAIKYLTDCHWTRARRS